MALLEVVGVEAVQVLLRSLSMNREALEAGLVMPMNSRWCFTAWILICFTTAQATAALHLITWPAVLKLFAKPEEVGVAGGRSGPWTAKKGLKSFFSSFSEFQRPCVAPLFAEMVHMKVQVANGVDS
jgi:hypothetical protein